MSKIQNSKREKCKHKKISNIKNEKYTFCEDCGGLIMKENTILHYVVKPISMGKKLCEDPIEIYKNMRKRCPIINDANIIQNSYLKKRKSVMTYLQKLSMHLKYSDSTFYKALNYIDNSLRKIIDINSKRMIYLTIGFFLISGKYNENDIFEPDFNDLTQLNDKFILQIEEILKYEIICLQLLDYNLINYSPYDWLMILLSNGFIFEEEIKGKSAFTINNIYNSIKKNLALITSKSFFFKYNPFKIAFSLIHIGRENFLNEEDGKYFKFIKELYNIKFSDYEDCYKEIKKEITISKKNKLTINDVNDNNIRDNKVKFQPSSNYSTNQLIKIDKNKNKHYLIQCYDNGETPPLIFNEQKINNCLTQSTEINYDFERIKNKTKTVKLENKIDLDNKNNNSKIKNDFVNHIDKISSGVFSENHTLTRRQNKLTGTVLIKDEDKAKFKINIKSKVKEYEIKARNKSEPNKKENIPNKSNNEKNKNKSNQKLPSLSNSLNKI